MPGNDHNAPPTGRALGRTEHSWCKAASSGTGITVLALQLSKPVQIPTLHNVFRKLQLSHPIFMSRIRHDSSKKTFSFTTPSTPTLSIKSFDLSTTSLLLNTLSTKCGSDFSPLHLIVEHEMNKNAWIDPSSFPEDGIDVFYVSLYELPGSKWVVALRLTAAACDRTTAVSLLKELPELVREVVDSGGDSDGPIMERVGLKEGGVVSMAVEDVLLSGKTKKSLWAHGLDMLEYSMNSLRLTHLKFKDTNGPRCSAVVRLQIGPHDTAQILAGCKNREIKLCGAIAAAGLIAAHSSNYNSDSLKKKYGVVTLMDCRSLLDPPLSHHHFGFYHSAILNVHTISRDENLWDVATRCYRAMENSKKCNKHIADMGDLNFLMCKAIDNPGLTASSSLRTTLISVFEDPVFHHSDQVQQDLGLQDYIGCASAHGVGPSIGIFDTIRDGQLDCACVYPLPLHSRQQMQDLVDHMKTILVDAAKCKHL